MSNQQMRLEWEKDFVESFFFFKERQWRRLRETRTILGIFTRAC